MATFVAVHGAWSAGWAWHRLHAPMTKRGHRLLTPTCTGLGERSHLLHPLIDLRTHIEDVCQVLEYEDLEDVILIGHSYGGMVVTGVADRMADRLRQLIYLDALLPMHGESVLDLLPPAHVESIRTQVAEQGHGWLIPAPALPPDTPDEEVMRASTRRHAQPLRTFTEPLMLRHEPPVRKCAYIFCRRINPYDSFRRSAQRAKSSDGWIHLEMDASHNPHITCPDELAEVLDDLAGRAG